MEALESFGGTNFAATMEDSMRKFARCLEGKTVEQGDEDGEKVKENVDQQL